MQASSDDVFWPDVMMGGHDEMRQHGLGPRTRVYDTATLQLGKLPLNSIGPQFTQNVELPLSRGVCPSIRQIDDHTLVDAVYGGMRFVNEAPKAFG